MRRAVRASLVSGAKGRSRLVPAPASTPPAASIRDGVERTVDAEDEYTDRFKATCVLATRADHALSGSQDVKVPVAFTGRTPVATDDDGTPAPDDTDPPGTGGASGGTAPTGWVAYRRSRAAA